jgi:hypothetical protein
MSLDKWSLPPAAVAILYKNVLIEPAQAALAAPTAKTAAQSLFLGNNQKKIAILVNQPGAGFIADDELEILLKILTACRLGLADVAIMNTSGHTPDWPLVKEQAAPVFCFLFGVKAEDIQLPVIFPPFHEHTFDGTVFLQAPSLAGIEADKLLKSKLWLCLKSMFRL